MDATIIVLSRYPMCTSRSANTVMVASGYHNLWSKEEIWLSPMTKAPTPTEMSKGQSDNTNNATKKFD